jgi:hypothetical protein
MQKIDRSVKWPILFAVAGFVACHPGSTDKQAGAGAGRGSTFEPADGKVILFVGQELEAIGGTDDYHDGYFDHFPAPGGFTQYTDFLTGSVPAGSPLTHKGLDGLTALADWGDGPENMSLTVNDPDFKNSCLAIGLDFSQGNDSVTAAGGHDDLIDRLGRWIKALGRRPVFLRAGYEFNGYDWNHYRAAFYIPAFRRIRDKFDSMQIRNVAYVWQAKGAGSTRSELDSFYPGDRYVDWVAYSYFIPADSSHPMIRFARDHKKPLFIAESSPVFLDSTGTCRPLDLTKDADVEWAWKEWFIPYFRTIRNNPDVIKAIHYINSPWKTRRLWKDNPYFKHIDARITQNDKMRQLWLGETQSDRYLKASDTLFDYLYNGSEH